MQALDPLVVRQATGRSVLCWLATVDVDGQPNVSPKEVFTYLEPDVVVIAQIASPQSVKNILARPQVCVSFLDVMVQKGLKCYGKARYIQAHEADFEDGVKPLKAMVGDRFTIQGLFHVRLESMSHILAPSYVFHPDTTTEAAQVEAARKAYGLWP